MRLEDRETSPCPEQGNNSPTPLKRWHLISDLLMRGRWRWGFRALFVLLFVLPTLMLMIVSMSTYAKDSTRNIMKAKELQGFLASTIVAEKLHSQFDLGTSFATRPLLIHYIEQGRWQKAMKILDGVLEQYTDIDRLVLFDPDAVIKADLPVAGVVGQSRANMEWYKEFSKLRNPYLSGVYLRNANPKIYVISQVLPIYSSSAGKGAQPKGEKPIAILQVQLNMRSFGGWTDIDVGHRGLIYIFDQYGHIVRHSQHKDVQEIIDYSSVGIVGKALAGQNGVELNFNPVERETRLASYRALPGYGWGVVVTQAADEAFAERDRNLQTYYFTYAALTFLSLLLSLAILKIVLMQRTAEEKQKTMALLDELTGLNNRRGFISLSSQQLTTADRLKQKLFFAYIDLNGMKIINDRFGHKEGDQALIDTAQIIKSAFREMDIKGRLGGDEFVVLGIVQDGFDADSVRERLQECTSYFLTENWRRYQLSLSTGIVLYDPNNPCRLEELMERGDRSMYEIKSKLRQPSIRKKILRLS